MIFYGLYAKNDKLEKKLYSKREEQNISSVIAFWSKDTAESYLQAEQKKNNKKDYIVSEITEERYIQAKKYLKNKIGEDHQLVLNFEHEI